MWRTVARCVANYFIRPPADRRNDAHAFPADAVRDIRRRGSSGPGWYAGTAAIAMFIILWREPYTDAALMNETEHSKVERTGTL